MDVIEENNDEETNEITKNNTSKDDSENGNLFLEVPGKIAITNLTVKISDLVLIQ